jgi:hypothetical protein
MADEGMPWASGVVRDNQFFVIKIAPIRWQIFEFLLNYRWVYIISPAN